MNNQFNVNRRQMDFPNPNNIYTGYTTALPKHPVVAMAYVPFQTDSSTYDEMKALKCGTLYPCLNKPFLGRGVR